MKRKRYIVKAGQWYADGDRNWSRRQADACRFTYAGQYPGGPKAWAKAHADSFCTKDWPEDNRPRVVRLTPHRCRCTQKVRTAT